MNHLAFSPVAGAIDPEEVAFRALGFIADRPPVYRSFLAVTGLTEAELLELPIRREYFAAVLSLVVGDERLLRDFARQTDLPLEEIQYARQDLLELQARH